MFNLFRHCRKDKISFDIVAETGNIVAKNGNNVEATFDTVERVVQLVAFGSVAGTLLLQCGRGFYKVACCFDNVASTLLLLWTGLKARFTLATMSKQHCRML